MAKRRTGGKRRAPRRTRVSSALLFAAGSAILPGLAHFRAGRRWMGLLLFGGFVALLVTVYEVGFRRRGDFVRLAVQPDWLFAVAAAAVLLAVAWAMLVLRSYQLLRPPLLGRLRRVAGHVGVWMLCLAVCAPFLLAARYAYVQHDLVTSLFSGSRQGGSGEEHRAAWRGMDRVNVLLLGSDAADNRIGVRTDSIHLASIDTRTGRTVLISLPRNLEDVPFPPGPLRQRFPNGFNDLLNAVYQYAVSHPAVAPKAPDPGAELLKRTVSEILGMPVHYYAIVDLAGFQDIVNAMGGVHMCVQRPIPYGHRGKVVEAGCRRLNGSEALWYGRSRTQSSDYDRMKRQRCLIGAMVRQADPVTVLRNYQGLAEAVKQIIRTDVPQALLPDMLGLGLKVKDADITSLQLVPPLISTGYPDYPHIRVLAHRAIQRAEKADTQPARSEPTPPRPGGHGVVPAPGGPLAAGPQPAPSDPRDTPEPVSLDAACP